MASAGGGAEYFLTLLTKSGDSLFGPNYGKDKYSVHPDDSSICMCVKESGGFSSTGDIAYLVNLSADGTTLNWQTAINRGSASDDYAAIPYVVKWNPYVNKWYVAGEYQSEFSSSYKGAWVAEVNHSNGSMSYLDKFYPSHPYRSDGNKMTLPGIDFLRYNEGSGTKTNTIIGCHYSQPNIRQYPSYLLYNDTPSSSSRGFKYDSNQYLTREDGDTLTTVTGSDFFLYGSTRSASGNSQAQIVKYSRSAGTGNYDDDWVLNIYPNSFTHKTYGIKVNASYDETIVYHAGEFQAIVGGSRQCGVTKWSDIDTSYPTLDWGRYVGGGTNSTSMTAMTVDSSGAVYALWVDNSTYSSSFLISKWNASGTLQWTRKFAYSDYVNRPSQMAIDDSSDSPAILFGSYARDATFSTYYHHYIFRYPTDGSVTGTYGQFTISSQTPSQSGSWTPSTTGYGVSENSVTVNTETGLTTTSTTDLGVGSTTLL